MALEITFFQGIAVAVLASVGIVVAVYIEVARKLESKVRDVTIKKAWIIEGELIKCLLVTSVLCTQKMFNLVSEKVGEENISKLWENLPEIVQSSLALPQETFASSLDDSEPLPKEVVEAIRLRDEERDRLFHLSSLGYVLKEEVPEAVSHVIDKQTLAIVCGLILGLLVPSFDFFFSQELELTWSYVFSAVSAVIIVTGYYYVRYGIMAMWSIRKLEKKVERLNRNESIDDIEETIEEIMG